MLGRIQRVIKCKHVSDFPVPSPPYSSITSLQNGPSPNNTGSIFSSEGLVPSLARNWKINKKGTVNRDCSTNNLKNKLQAMVHHPKYLLCYFYLGTKVAQNVAQYPLHHVKFEVAMSNSLGDAFTRKYII